MKKPTHLYSISRQSGVTLVELLIAMLIGAFLVGGILQVFAGARQTYRVHDATSRMQETGRMALEVMTRDIRMADFWGCASKSIDLVDNLDSSGTGYEDFVTGGSSMTSSWSRTAPSDRRHYCGHRLPVVYRTGTEIAPRRMCGRTDQPR